MDIVITEDLDSPAIQKLAGKYQIIREPALWNDSAKMKKMCQSPPLEELLVKSFPNPAYIFEKSKCLPFASVVPESFGL